MKTGKKFISLMLACIMFTGTAYLTYSITDAATVSVSAETQSTSDGWSYEIKDDGTAKIVGYSKEGGDLIIPNTVDRKKVTEIGDYSFKNKKGYQSLTVPETVEVIGRNAFEGCTGLRSIDIKSGVETIRSGAFNGCTGLRSVTIQNGVETIESDAFGDCTALENIILPDSVKTIGSMEGSYGNGVFANCSKLAAVKFGKNLGSVGNSTFYECTALKVVEFGDDVLEIGSDAFLKCSALENIVLPKNLETIGRSCFRECSELKSVVIPSNVKEISSDTFKSCVNLTSVTIPENSEYIGDSSFYGCSALTYVKIPDKVISVGSEAFKDCTSLQNISFGTSLEAIYSHAFENTKIENIILPASLKTPEGNWDGIFQNCAKLKTVTFQSDENTDLTEVAPDMFRGCVKLTDVNILATVTTIKPNAFGNCDSLESIIIPESVTTIEGRAFENCKALKKVIIPESVTEIKGGNWDSSFEGHDDKLTIYGYTGSEAENYAKEEKIKFVTLDGHEHENEVHIIKATCEDGGMEITRCKICGHFEQAEYINPTGHKNVKITKQATCTENGERKGTCTECGKTVIEVIPATGHNWVDWKTDRNDSKKEVRTCVNCGEKEYRDAPENATLSATSESSESPTNPTNPTVSRSTVAAADKEADESIITDSAENPMNKMISTLVVIFVAVLVLVVIVVVIILIIRKRRKNNMNVYR